MTSVTKKIVLVLSVIVFGFVAVGYVRGSSCGPTSVLSSATLMLGFVWAMWDENHFTWQDRMSQTYVTAAPPLSDSDAFELPPGRRTFAHKWAQASYVADLVTWLLALDRPAADTP